MVVVENQATTATGGGGDGGEGIMADVDNWRSTRRSQQGQGDHDNMNMDKGRDEIDDSEADGDLSEDLIVMIATERANSMQVQRDQQGQPIYSKNDNEKAKDGIDKTIDSKSKSNTSEEKDAVSTEKVSIPGFTAVSAGGGASAGAPTGKDSSEQGVHRNVSVGAIQVTPVGLGGRIGAAGTVNSGDYDNLTGSGSEFMVPVVANVVDEEANRRQYTLEIREEILRDAAHAEEVIPTKEVNEVPSSSNRKLMAIVGVIVLVVIIVVAAVVSKDQKNKKEDKLSPVSDWDYLVDLFTSSSSTTTKGGVDGEGGGWRLTDPDTLLDESSPQYQALDWLANVDTLYRDGDDTSVSMIQSVEKRFLEERYAMAVLYYSTSNGDGGWIDDMKFLSNTTLCEWEGITCNRQNQTLTLEIGKYSLPNEIEIET